MGKGVIIRSRRHNQVDIFVAPGAHLEIGDGAFLNQGVRIGCFHEVRIGEGCAIGDEVVILDSDFHSVDAAPARTGRATCSIRTPLRRSGRLWRRRGAAETVMRRH